MFRCINGRVLIALLVAMLLVALPVSAVGGLSPKVLRLKTGTFDPKLDSPALSPALRHAAEPDSGFFVAQLDRPATALLLERLARRAIRVVQYLPDDAFVVQLDAPAKERLRAMPELRWLGVVEPGWKLAPDLGTRRFDDPTRRAGGVLYATVDLFPGQTTADAAGPIAASGVTVIRTDRFGDTNRFRVSGTRAQLEALARIPSVGWIEEVGEMQLRNDTTRWVVQTDQPGNTSISNHGLRGQGQIIGHIDGSIDRDSCYFEDTTDNTPGPGHRKLVAYRSNSGFGSDGHGTHTAGTMAGKQIGSTAGAGQAYAARLSHSNLGDITGLNNTTSNLYTYLESAHNDGARVHGNSWGDDNTTAYTTWCRDIDAFSHDFENSLVVFAATNLSSLRSPENAKNVLSVGATLAGLNDDQFCSGGSGPTADGRRKPEIFAPGCGIVSAASGAACGTVSDSGTSMACPAISGAGTLVRQYYKEGWHPSGSKVSGDALTASGALIKATLINSAVDMTGVPDFPSNKEGWGRVLLENALYFAGDVRRLALLADIRNNLGLNTGESDSFPISVLGSGEDLKVTLVFTDPPAAPLAASAAVNDLDLELLSPSGVLYLGNVFNPLTGLSVTGGAADSINNVEQVRIVSPESGEWLATIRANSVNQGRQGYAAVATGQVDPAVGGSLRYSNSVVDDSGALGNNDGVIDPGETVTLPLTLLNLRQDTATGISAQLFSDGPTPAKVTGGVAAFPDIASNATGSSLSPHYTVTINPDAVCGELLPFALQADHTSGSNDSAFLLSIGRNELNQVAGGTPLALPAFSATPTTSTIQITDPLTVGSVDISLHVTHVDTSEMVITLSSPQGTTVTLHDRSAGVDIDTNYDMGSAPDGPGSMNDFDGENPVGTWTLSVLDDFIGLPITPAGALESWSLHISASAGGVCTPFSCGQPVPAEVGPSLTLSVSSGTDLQLDWPAVSGATGYHVWRSKLADFTREEFVGATAGTTLLLPGGAGTVDDAYYRVRAINSCSWEGP